jgi:type I site-specific restriction-modification system R (restriction) subunit
MLFVNGIPFGLIECKSPMLGKAWKQKAIEQKAKWIVDRWALGPTLNW